MTHPLPDATIDDENGIGAAAARDSLTVAVWTTVSRITGVARVVVIGAVLGPTFFGNAYQLTNVLPNLLFYGFLAGSLLSSLLVPALVRHIDAGDDAGTARVASGFLGVEWLVLLLVCPLAVVAAPLLLPGGEAVMALAALAVPQVFCYAMVASATAVMYAKRRYLLAAAAPALENLGVMAVLLLAAVLFADPGTPSDAALLLIGGGSTLAVVLHAGVQWWGARRCGVTLAPTAGWRDDAVRQVVRRALRSMAQAGLLAAQTLLLLAVAGQVAGGTVALQMSLNFYHLPLAIAAAPVGLALLPRLSRLVDEDQQSAFADAYVRAVGLAMFLVVPAAVGYVVLAAPLANSVAAGRMGSAVGVAMVTGSLAALALGLVGEALFVISTQAAYARGDARTPLRSMLVQSVVCAALVVPILVVPDRSFDSRTLVTLLAGAFAISCIVGGVHLSVRVRRGLAPSAEGLWPSLVRTVVASVAMGAAAWLAARLVESALDGTTGWIAASAGGTLVGIVVYAGVHLRLRSAELRWLLDGARG